MLEAPPRDSCVPFLRTMLSQVLCCGPGRPDTSFRARRLPRLLLPCRTALLSSPGSLAASLQEQREQYATEGWLHVPGVLSSHEVQLLHDEADRLERLGGHLEASANLGGVYYETQSATGRKREPAVFPGALRKLTRPSRRSVVYAELSKHAALLRLLRDVCSVPSPRCAVDQINTKLARVGTGFPWHQDSSFLVGDARARLARYGGANIVLSLDRSDSSTGGFEVLGRTHTGPVVDLRGGRYDASASLDDGREEIAGWDTSRRHCPTLEPGDALLFSPYLAHGSGWNQSARRRRIATLWFVGGGE